MKHVRTAIHVDRTGNSASLLLIEEDVRGPSQHEGIPEQLAWVEEMLKYNTVGGKMNRGMGVVDVLRAFSASEGRELTHEEVGHASCTGDPGDRRRFKVGRLWALRSKYAASSLDREKPAIRVVCDGGQ